ncbi:MAG: hypothetical protein ACTHWA_05205 [Arachnia sp.]
MTMDNGVARGWRLVGGALASGISRIMRSAFVEDGVPEDDATAFRGVAHPRLAIAFRIPSLRMQT